ncbi:MAG: hypothetical protein COV69_00790 [Parcubacteria group bacterium CG11_big_fil_rev_8_21_14_0_20_39_14]|nr:MAG: hypothetical protein COV69_00790 [Parcubacteria group bacterium CG11_big_fil_rev_8_21_14_0_20_39_14]
MGFIFWELYVFFVREKFFLTIKFVLLEISLPREVEKTPKAMEQVWDEFHGLHDIFNLKELYIKGEFVQWLSCEIVSNGGKIHFYIRTPEIFRDLVESALYSQYPEVEISEVEDYVSSVPADIPNRAYDMWGSDFILTKSDPYPIKCYEEFEEIKEEKRVDPLSSLVEGLGTLKEGEQIWLQILAQPILFEGRPAAEKLISKLFGKKFDEESGTMKELGKFTTDIIDIITTGRKAETNEEISQMDMFKSFMLTPGEREILEGIEKKMDKLPFFCNIRFIYIAKKEIFFKPKIRLAMSPFKQFTTLNANGIKIGPNKTKINYFFVDRRVYYRKRRLLRFYKRRLFEVGWKPNILNAEELATIFHFPGKLVAPAPMVSRVEARKGEPPPTLPTE